MLFLLHFARLFVSLAIAEGTFARKSSNKFGFSLAYSYLCKTEKTFLQPKTISYKLLISYGQTSAET